MNDIPLNCNTDCKMKLRDAIKTVLEMKDEFQKRLDETEQFDASDVFRAIEDLRTAYDENK